MIPFPDRLALKLVIGIGCVLLLALLVQDRNRWKAKTAHYAELLSAERAAHAATVAGYQAAAERARRADAANAARVKSQQRAINQRSAHDLESRLAAARAAAERLRRDNETAAADSGGRRAAPVPDLSAAARGTAQAAGEDRLPHADQRARRDRGALGPEDALIATEQAIQLDELINWVRRQGDVRVDDSSD
jgi:hypothetical protein